MSPQPPESSTTVRLFAPTKQDDQSSHLHRQLVPFGKNASAAASSAEVSGRTTQSTGVALSPSWVTSNIPLV